MTVKVAVSGAAGRMGQEIIAAVTAAADLQLVLAFEHGHHPAVGTIAADGQTAIEKDEAILTTEAEVLIDFTAPETSAELSGICAARGIGMVIGTTGFDDSQRQRLAAAGEHIPLLVAQNMSVGVNALYQIAAYAAKILGAGRLGGGYDMEVGEEHHRDKKDAPSGTALRLGQALAAATGSDFNNDAVFTRQGANALRQPHDIGFSVARGGDIVGTHRVLFAGRGEQLEIIHRSTSRANYAAGAVRAARFIATARPGLYDDMSAVLTPSA